jgi:hypothetical protein
MVPMSPFDRFLLATSVLALLLSAALAVAASIPPAGADGQQTGRAGLLPADQARLHTLAPPAMSCLGHLLPLWHHTQALAPWVHAGLRPEAQEDALLYQQGRTMRDACWASATVTMSLRFAPGAAHDPARRTAAHLHVLLVQAAMGADSAAAVGADLAVHRMDLATGDLATALRHLEAAGRDDPTAQAIFGA